MTDESVVLFSADTGVYSVFLYVPGLLPYLLLKRPAYKNMCVCRHVLGANRELQYVLPTHSQGANLFSIGFLSQALTLIPNPGILSYVCVFVCVRKTKRESHGNIFTALSVTFSLNSAI